MSAESLKRIIGRAIVEPAFRQLLFNNPDKALEGYGLSAGEVEALKSLSAETLEAAVGELESRVSRAGLGLGDSDELAAATRFDPYKNFKF